MDSQHITNELDFLYTESDSSPSNKRPRKSKLDPYRVDILARRSEEKSYRQIRDWLFHAHGLVVNHTTIFDFVARCLSE